MSHSYLQLFGALLVALSHGSAAPAQNGEPFAFSDETAASGISGNGPTFGPGAWGDVNSDGLPDLWVGNHAFAPQLFVNLGGGLFADHTQQWVVGELTRDTHGAAWADVDGDGDQDLVELVGTGTTSTGQNHLWWNDAGKLVDISGTAGMSFGAGRGRSPLWVDYNQDGRLDLITINLYRPNSSASLPFLQTSGPGQTPLFVMDWPGSGFEPTTQSSEFAHLVDITGDGVLDIVVDGSPYPSAVYDMSPVPMVDRLIQSSFQGVTTVVDAVYGDFDFDGRNDAYLCRDRIEADSEAVLIGEREMRGKIFVKGDERGFSFAADAALSVEFPEGTALNEIRLGLGGVRPQSTRFELDPVNPTLHGIVHHQPGVDRGVYLGFDSAERRWTLLMSSPGRSQIGAIFRGGPMRDVQMIPRAANPLEDSILMRTSTGFVAGSVDLPHSSRSAVAGDFDNDMDLDLYLVRSGAAANRTNVLLENLGDGTFRAVPSVGAAAGHSGAAASPYGLGDGVVSVDYDSDGWLDLFVTNGFGNRFFSGDGPHQLFRNRSKDLHPDHHWLLVELKGPGGNLDAIGAQVRVRVGGKVLLREQNGGVHRLGQNHQRIHFGLGTHSQVDEVHVRWPDGTETTLGPKLADQVLKIQN